MIQKRIHYVFITVGILLILAGVQSLFAEDVPFKTSKSQSKEEVSVDSVRNKTPQSVSTGINSVSSLPNQGTKKEENQLKAEKKQVVSISIRGKKNILSTTSFPFHAGETPLNLLITATKSKHIQVDYQGFGPTAYVVGIANLYEMDKGPQSGWVFRVNGKVPKESCGTYRLHPGEVVEWLYTYNLGKDVGATLQ